MSYMKNITINGGGDGLNQREFGEAFRIYLILVDKSAPRICPNTWPEAPLLKGVN